ncbi:MFS general substrate transporter [Mollisia scopiformis]|uniref:MFS general substrate transporter n=1 Tax=Mollisia scopiformis TaxID=149040 RepID=A0A194WZM6_MOLSC|nr:MFS general substrate transporter [Mollisia scopiformis]KUJ13395.1 MFS general substrate transporter [Mollisia scopiformis]
MDHSKEVEDALSIHTESTKLPDEAPDNQDLESQLGHQPAPEEKTPTDPNIVDWDGPDDPANPMNWSTGRKVGAIGMTRPLASTIIASGAEDVLVTFHSTNQTLGAFVTSVYLLGYCFGPLVIAPLSEIYGRTILYNVCNAFFFIFNIACAVANSLGSLIVFRLLSGIAASCPITLGAGSISDMVPLEKRGLAMVFWIMGPVLGPTFGPLAGAYLAQAKGWRWIFWLLTILSGVVFVITLLLMRESYAFVLLKRKTERLRKETGNSHLRSVLDTGRTNKDLLKFSIVRPTKLLFLSPIVFLMSLYLAIVYGYLYLLFTTFPRVFQDQYGFSNGAVGLTYLGSGAGAFLGLFFCGAVSDRLAKALKNRNGGDHKPEYRLPLMFIGALIVPASLFLYGWTTEYKVHWIVPIIATAIFSFGLFTVMMPTTTYLVDAYTTYAASVTAAATVIRSLLGALLPLAGSKMYDALGLGWGTSVLGFIAVAFIPVPFLFWMYGERIRKSKLFRVHF